MTDGPTRPSGAERTPIRVFVHLGPNFDPEAWRSDWLRGEIVGVNEPSPYGYHRANEMGCVVTFSTHSETRVGKAVRLALRVLAGFDLLHAWRNRHAIRAADVVWTHSESHGLGVAAALWPLPRQRRPALILQNVWLIDRWARYPAAHRALFKRLLRRADVLTFLSPVNRDIAAELFAGVRCEFVHYGIRSDEKYTPRAPDGRRPLSILALGNDEHRDWATMVAGAEKLPDARLTVVSRNFPKALTTKAQVSVRKVENNRELEEIFAASDILLLTLKPNKHASGVTVLQEAVLHGLPVVATDTGGLKEYFDETMVHYVEPSDASAVADAIRRATADPDRSLEMVHRAQQRMSGEGISSEAYVRRHVELSKEILDHHEKRAAGAVPRA
jgi:glycosyltransferase involved in cell wall biosynthesis